MRKEPYNTVNTCYYNITVQYMYITVSITGKVIFGLRLVVLFRTTNLVLLEQKKSSVILHNHIRPTGAHQT